MKLVIIESPCAGDRARNRRYACAATRDSLMRGEAPLASHVLYDQEGILNDDLEWERKLGMEAGFAWGEKADLVAVYTDLGISDGMRQGIIRAETRGTRIEFRELGAVWRAWS